MKRKLMRALTCKDARELTALKKGLVKGGCEVRYQDGTQIFFRNWDGYLQEFYFREYGMRYYRTPLAESST